MKKIEQKLAHIAPYEIEILRLEGWDWEKIHDSLKKTATAEKMGPHGRMVPDWKYDFPKLVTLRIYTLAMHAIEKD